MDRLPPLNAVRAFEAAARHVSITLAADELNVTPGAVSRQIMALEEALGLQLLKRGHRQISLTRQGAEYFRAAASALDALREATRKARRRTQRKQLKIRAYTTFAMRWLIPRLSGFHAAHPGIEVLLKASLEPVDFRKEDIDGAIRLGDGRWPGTHAWRLVPNILAPVASPALLKSGPKLKRPADLAQHTLLHTIARPDDWGYWLEAAGAAQQVDARAGMTFESSAMSLAAAIEGQGVAMAQMFLVEKDLEEGPAGAAFQEDCRHGRVHLLPAHAGPPRGTGAHEGLPRMAAGSVQERVKAASPDVIGACMRASSVWLPAAARRTRDGEAICWPMRGAAAQRASNARRWRVGVCAVPSASRFVWCRNWRRRTLRAARGMPRSTPTTRRPGTSPTWAGAWRVGKELYGLLGIAKGDTQSMARADTPATTNSSAPRSACSVTLERGLEGQAAWLDLGMYLHGVMLAALGHGLE